MVGVDGWNRISSPPQRRLRKVDTDVLNVVVSSESHRWLRKKSGLSTVTDFVTNKNPDTKSGFFICTLI